MPHRIQRKWATYLRDARPNDGRGAKRDSELEESVAVTRAILVDCAPLEVAEPLWDRVVLVAADMNPLLPATEAEALWRELGRAELCGGERHPRDTDLDPTCLPP